MGTNFATMLLAVAMAAPPAPEEPAILIPSSRAGASDLFLVDPLKGDAKNVTKTEAAEEIHPAWSADGKKIAFACKTKDHDLEIYTCDADGTNRKRLTTAESPSGCFAPSWSSDGTSIAYMRIQMNGKHEVRVVNADGTKDRLFSADASAPVWNPDGSSIAFVAKKNGKTHALCSMSPDGGNAKTLVEDLGPDAPFFPAWSPDGKQIVYTAGTDHGLQLFLVPAAGGSPRQLTHLPGFNMNAVWLANDRILFAHSIQYGQPNGGYAAIKTDGTRLIVHPLAKLEPPHALGRPAVFVPRSPKNADNPVKPAAHVEPAAAKKPAIKVSPAATVPPPTPGAVVGAAWLDNKRFALSLEAGLLLVADFENNAVKPGEAFAGHEGAVQAAAFSPDGKLVYSAGSDKSVRIWDMAAKGSKSIEKDHDASLDSLALSKSGKLLATGDRDGKLKVRDAATAKPLRELTVCDPKRGAVHALAFGQDDAVIFAGCANWGMPVLHGLVAAYDPADGKELWRTKGTFGGVFALALSPDGTKLAGACLDTFIRIWDAKTGKELACWKGHHDRATGVAWALDGKVVLSCGFDHTVRVWDAASGEVLHVLAAHAGPVVRVAVSPDGKHALSTGQAGAVCVWKLSEEKP